MCDTKKPQAHISEFQEFQRS